MIVFLHQVLYAQDIDQRSVTFEKAIKMSHFYEERARMTILRTALLKQNIVVKNSSLAGGGPMNEQLEPVYPTN